ncbi:hypothetical protein HRR83_002344 [Exophiala dermatitidis]|uniref:Uncharacterized protein n=1 Tax=Exophiala dermatitidis TaxID=5970 RepID=A0AAN6EWL9_EXODE|nr:hypothetical protein HRR74_002421 [Exophiala dermatitidis]KAJ4525503.1 hypothetical protein HRR73_002233 [Exophiala dermatitidis]KAJ4536820.1 hypothetical protein HRR76_004846 [Exophiala dermatitidis]KAJ4555578.1 hypothetical protein HRR77_001508 [Exophiala dermatitidis]KAJ4568882.1 hypothetical protein HRR81_006539 [Exophiala dermatitidis]
MGLSKGVVIIISILLAGLAVAAAAALYQVTNRDKSQKGYGPSEPSHEQDLYMRQVRARNLANLGVSPV